jgi:hypothetical protein
MKHYDEIFAMADGRMYEDKKANIG